MTTTRIKSQQGGQKQSSNEISSFFKRKMFYISSIIIICLILLYFQYVHINTMVPSFDSKTNSVPLTHELLQTEGKRDILLKDIQDKDISNEAREMNDDSEPTIIRPMTQSVKKEEKGQEVTSITEKETKTVHNEDSQELRAQLKQETMLKTVREILRTEDNNFYWVDPDRFPRYILNRVLSKSILSTSFDEITNEFNDMRRKLAENTETNHRSGLDKTRELPHHLFSMTVNVVTYNRPRSLARLCNSLKEAIYYGHKINLNFFVEKGADQETLEFVKKFEWPHGNKSIRIRFVKAGLVSAIIESWYPTHEHDYVLLAEDDIEVSKYWYLWILETMKQYRYPSSKHPSSQLDYRIFGISLYTPRESENSMPRFMYYPDRNFKQTAWLHQIPCSWGAVYFPEHWRFYRHYIEMRRRLGKNVNIPSCECNGWTGSWVKYFTELAYLKGWYMVYPNFANQTSFSTNHLEPGVHIKTDETKHRKEAFTVPLANENIVPVDNMPNIHDLPVLDYKYTRYNDRRELAKISRFSWLKFLKELKETETKIPAPIPTIL